MDQVYTKEQIANGFRLAQGWYEGRRLEEMEIEQIVEAIQVAAKLL